MPLLQDYFTDQNYTLKDGQISPNKLWKSMYNGYGVIGVRNISLPSSTRSSLEIGKVMYMAPRQVTSPNNTSACLLLSQQTFKDFEANFYMRTLSHTRKNTKPKNWETAWFMFRYTDLLPNGKTEDKHHHYYFYIAKNGMIEIGKKDYVVFPNGLITPDGVKHEGVDQEQQQYLTTEPKVTFRLKKWFKIKLICKGSNIKLWVDDVLKADITDDGKIGEDQLTRKKPIGYPASDIMLSGKIGLYCEDSAVEFDNISVKSIT